MNAFLALVLKDLKLFAGDRKAVILTVAVPIAIGSFFGFVMGGQSGETKSSGIQIEVVDADHSKISGEIIAGLQRDESLKIVQTGEAEARTHVRQGKTALAVIIPAGFGDAAGQALFGGGEKPVIDLPHDPSRRTEVSMVRGILTQHIMEVVSRETFSGAGSTKALEKSLAQFESSSNNFSPELKESFRGMIGSVEKWIARSGEATNSTGSRRGGGMGVPFATRETEEAKSPQTAGPRYNGYAHSFGGMGVQFILMAAIELGVGLLLERQGGIWKRLRSAPLSRFTLLVSRMASSAFITFSTLLFIFGFSMVVFHVRIQGSVAGFILCCASIAAFAASLGLFIGSLGRTPQATRGIAIFVVLIMVMLGGAWIPSFIFPHWLQTATLVMPTRWAIDGLDAMTWRGLGFSTALAASGVLLAYAAAFTGIALARFRWETA